MAKFIYLLAAALALAACAHASSHDLPSGARYVNIGSSFAAGAGTGPAPAGSPARCYQSTANYAHLLAERLDLALTDVSCGGATSAHILNVWNELPAQIDAVTSDTKLVTITVGGNDIAFAGNLTAASCEQDESIRVAGFVLPCPSRFPVADDAYGTLERNLREVARQLAVRAPTARVVFIQYVALVPETQCAQSRFTEEEAAELRTFARRLADITTAAAAETGASVLRMDEFAHGHTACDADPWSTGLPRDYDGARGAPWHPNQRGMAVIADRLAQLLAR
jgi:lysophospholipase L1-like esterase